MQRHLSAILLILLVSVWDAGCHKKQVAVPLPPAPAPAAAAPESTAPAQAQPATPPTTPTTPPAQPPTQPPTAQPSTAQPPTATQPPAEEPPKPQRRPAKPGAPPANQPPQLGTPLTPEQQRQYNNAIDRSLGRAQANLRAIGNRQLNAEQHDRVVQVESFIQQAEALRKTNLMGAKSMAQRAELLARDLLASLR